MRPTKSRDAPSPAIRFIAIEHRRGTHVCVNTRSVLLIPQDESHLFYDSEHRSICYIYRSRSILLRYGPLIICYQLLLRFTLSPWCFLFLRVVVEEFSMLQLYVRANTINESIQVHACIRMHDALHSAMQVPVVQNIVSSFFFSRNEAYRADDVFDCFPRKRRCKYPTIETCSDQTRFILCVSSSGVHMVVNDARVYVAINFVPLYRVHDTSIANLCDLVINYGYDRPRFLSRCHL